MKTTSSTLIAVVVALLCGSLRAANEPTAQQRAIAETLFEKGKTQMAAHQYEAACESFKESFRLDPVTNTQFKLAEAHEKAGRTASAWSGYLSTVALAKKEGRQDKADTAQAEADRLEPTLSKIVVEVGQGARVEGLEIVVGKTPIGKAAWGTEIPFDPGKHQVSAQAPGYESWTGRVTVPPKAGMGTVQIPKLKLQPQEAPLDSPATGTTEASGGLSPWFWTGLAATVAGVGAAVGGGAWWGSAASSWNSAYQTAKDTYVQCYNGECVPDEEYEKELEKQANEQAGTIPPAGAIGLIVGGGVVAAVGVTLLVVFSGGDDDGESARAPTLTPQVGLGYGGLQLRF